MVDKIKNRFLPFLSTSTSPSNPNHPTTNTMSAPSTSTNHLNNDHDIQPIFNSPTSSNTHLFPSSQPNGLNNNPSQLQSPDQFQGGQSESQGRERAPSSKLWEKRRRRRSQAVSDALGQPRSPTLERKKPRQVEEAENGGPIGQQGQEARDGFQHDEDYGDGGGQGQGRFDQGSGEAKDGNIQGDRQSQGQEATSGYFGRHNNNDDGDSDSNSKGYNCDGEWNLGGWKKGRTREEERWQRPEEFDRDYTVPEHIEIFEKALSSQYDFFSLPGKKIEHISAVSDFAPIKQRIKRSSKRNRRDIVREGWSYDITRWPLLMGILFVVFLEFLGYIFVRQLVNVQEFFTSWWGRRGVLRHRLRRARNYVEWMERALELDKFLGYDSWKSEARNAYYDSNLVNKVLNSLKELREQGDYDGVRAVLEVCVRSNFAGVESPRMYSETCYGTKWLIEDYVDEVEKCLAFIRNAPEEIISTVEKARFFKYASKNFGTTALCLSGGASFGYYHFGVCRALLDAGLLPKVITGTSAGSLIAAFICTHTDDELRRLMIPLAAEKLTACSDPISVWLPRYLKTGARFDPVYWARQVGFWTMGSMTFQEAYERTGRILNVSVVPTDAHSPTKLLNYLTAPNCVIFTACIASAAVPGILPPVVLLTKDKHGKVEPWAFQGRHKDGSLRVDIPLKSLHLLYNVNYSIVSQVNPHVHLFFFQPRGSPGRPVSHRKGKGWRGGFLLSAAEQVLKLEIVKNFRLIKDLELMPTLAGMDMPSIFLQKFEGTITLFPKSRLLDWVHLLTDPDEKELTRMFDAGHRCTWPKLHMIENRMRIEVQIDLGREQLRRALQQARPHPERVSRVARDPTRDIAQLNRDSRDTMGLSGAESTVESPSEIEDAIDHAQQAGQQPVNIKKMNRRKAALARLGLKSTSEHSSKLPPLAPKRKRARSKSEDLALLGVRSEEDSETDQLDEGDPSEEDLPPEQAAPSPSRRFSLANLPQLGGILRRETGAPVELDDTSDRAVAVSPGTPSESRKER